MDYKQKRHKKNLIIVAIIYLQIFTYIVLANAFTINLGNRMPLKISEIFSVLVFIVTLVMIIKNNDKIKLKIKNRYKWLLFWIIFVLILDVFCIIRYKYSVSDSMYGLLYLFRIIHIIILVKCLSYLMKYAGIKSRKMISFIKLCYFFVVIIGLFQLVFYPVAYDWYDVFYKFGFYWPTPDPHHDRLLSTYFDPNYLASCLVIPIAICLAQLLRLNNKNKIKKIELLIEIAFFFVAILLTKSRSGIVGFGVAIIAFCILFGVRRKTSMYTYITFAIIIFTFMFMFLFSNISVFERIRNFSSDPSAQHRFDSWSISIQYLKDSNFIGIGYNMLGAYKSIIGEEVGRAASYGMDSSLLFILATTGIVGFVIFAYGILKMLTYKNINYVNNAVKIIIISSIVISFFNNLLFNVIWLFPIFFIETNLNIKLRIRPVGGGCLEGITY